MHTCAEGVGDGGRRQRRAQTRDEFSYGGCEVGIGIAPRDSQTDRINANNWILPAISVSLERCAAQLRNAPRRRRYDVEGCRDEGCKELQRQKEDRSRKGEVRKSGSVPVVGESLPCHPVSPPLSTSPFRIHQLADYVIYSAYFMRKPAI